jgi:hypothetical protein
MSPVPKSHQSRFRAVGIGDEFISKKSRFKDELWVLRDEPSMAEETEKRIGITFVMLGSFVDWIRSKGADEERMLRPTGNTGCADSL